MLSTENRNFRVSAVIPGENPAFGLIEGYDQERGELIMKRIDSSFEDRSWRESNFFWSWRNFSERASIGEVTEVSTDDYGLTKLAYIRPAAEFSMLDHVIDCEKGI